MKAKFMAPCIILGIVLWQGAKADALSPQGESAYQNVTGDDSTEDRGSWDRLYSTSTYVFGKEPAPILKEVISQLPVGRALDIAMGEGRNAVYLAKKGFVVEGVDISQVALSKARRLAREQNVSIHTFNADLKQYTIKPNAYEVILNIDFLERALIPQIRRGLKKGGVVVFVNSTVDQLKNPSGQSLRRDYLLSKGELKEAFKDFEILIYREQNDGKSATATLVAKRK